MILHGDPQVAGSVESVSMRSRNDAQVLTHQTKRRPMIGVEAQAMDDGRLLGNVEFVFFLRAAGLDTFEKIMAHPGGTVIRSVPGRSTVRIELRQNSGASQVVFLKRYEREYLTFGKKLLRFLRWPGAD